MLPLVSNHPHFAQYHNFRFGLNADIHGSDVKDRCGSQPVLADLAQRRRLSEVERTSRPRKRTLLLEGRLLGVERSGRRRGRNRRL